ncbi:hypothetical protein FRB96_000539 [Tulasnella sp. 330]|nr:hypothetical protein FRB96_000539 [Tulasnella sp. 330]
MPKTVDNDLFARLDQSTWEVKAYNFVEKLLYRWDDGPLLEHDLDIAQKCLVVMKTANNRQWKDFGIEEVDHKNVHGDENWSADKTPIPLAEPSAVTNATNSGRRSTRAQWNAAIIAPQPDPDHHLQRVFVGTFKRKTYFADKEIARPDCFPDLSVVLLGPVAKGEDRKSYWRDIKVVIEAKLDNTSLAGVRPNGQAARYVRRMKMEQFDRN